MKKFLLFCLLMNFTLASAQFTQTLISKVWEQTTGTPSNYDWSSSTVDSHKNYIVTGNTIDTVNQLPNIHTIKYRNDSTIAWVRDWHSTYDSVDYGIAVKTDASDNVYVAGTTCTSSSSSYDYVLLKYDSTGTLLWSRTYNGSASSLDIASDIALDAFGNIFVTGTRTAITTLNDYCTIKYNSSGLQLWVSTYDYASLFDIAVAIVINNSSGRIVVTGGSQSLPNSWDYATLNLNTLNGNINSVSRTPSGGVGFDLPTAIARDDHDNYYVTGRADSTGQGFNIRTVKFDSALTIMWTRSWDGAHFDDQGNSIGVDAYGNVYVTGYSTKDNGATDYVTIKYSSGGSVIWTNRYMAPDETDNAQAQKLTLDPYSNIYITGKVMRDGNYDFCTIAYNQDGDLQLEKFFCGDTGANDIPTFIKLVDNKYLFVTGVSRRPTHSEYVSIKYEVYQKQDYVEYDTLSNPLYVKNEVIVSFDPSVVDTANVDDKDKQFGTPRTFLDSATVAAIEKALHITFDREQVIKIFEHLTTKK